MAALAACALCGCAPQLELVIALGPDLQAAPEFLRFEVVTLDTHDVTKTGPYSVDATPNEEFAEIPPGTPFMIDVIGCPTSEEAGCAKAAQFLARGCTPPLSLGRGESKTQQVDLQPALSKAADDCDAQRK